MNQISFLNKFIIWLATILLGLFMAKTIAIYGIKIVMKKFPEIYTEQSLNQFGLSKEKKQ